MHRRTSNGHWQPQHGSGMFVLERSRSLHISYCERCMHPLLWCNFAPRRTMDQAITHTKSYQLHSGILRACSSLSYR